MDRYEEMTGIMEDTGTILLLAAVLAGTVLVRLLMQRTEKTDFYSGLSIQTETEEEGMLPDLGVCQTTGTCELQSDCVQVSGTRAGVMAAMATGSAAPTLEKCRRRSRWIRCWTGMSRIRC